MPILETVKQNEQWIIEVNGSYDICFVEHTLVAASAVDGEVLVNATEGIDGILSGDAVAGDKVRVMVRGNPSKVDKLQLTGVTTGLDASIILV